MALKFSHFPSRQERVLLSDFSVSTWLAPAVPASPALGSCWAWLPEASSGQRLSPTSPLGGFMAECFWWNPSCSQLSPTTQEADFQQFQRSTSGKFHHWQGTTVTSLLSSGLESGFLHKGLNFSLEIVVFTWVFCLSPGDNLL